MGKLLVRNILRPPPLQDRVKLFAPPPFNRVLTQVLQSLICDFPFIRPYKVLFRGIFDHKSLIKFYFCLKKRFQN